MRFLLAVLFIALIASPALATDSTPAPATNRAFTCDSGPFVKTLTRVKLAAAFGKANARAPNWFIPYPRPSNRPPHPALSPH